MMVCRRRPALPARHISGCAAICRPIIPTNRWKSARVARPNSTSHRLVQVFRAVREILADDGTLWIVIGDSYASSRSARPASAYIGGKHGAAQVSVNRITPTGDIKPKDLLGIPWLLAFALRRDGWTLRQDIIWHKPNAMPESMTDRCTRAHEYLFLLSKRPRYLRNRPQDFTSLIKTVLHFLDEHHGVSSWIVDLRKLYES